MLTAVLTRLTGLKSWFYGIALAALIGAVFWARGHWIEVGEARVQARWDAAVAQAVTAAKAKEAADASKVEEQNLADRERITDLETRLAAALDRPDPAPRIVRLCDAGAGGDLPGPAIDAGGPSAGGASGPPMRSADDPRRVLRELRAEFLQFAARCQRDNVAAMAGQAQWPK